jgi:hypothetical protein
MAQPPQTEAADGGANVAKLCGAQKLLDADGIAPAHPQNAAEAPTMENLKPLQLGGRDGPGLCSIQQDRKHQAAIYARFGASGDLPVAPELGGPLHCCTRCCKSPADFLVEAAVRAEVAAQIAKMLHARQLMPAKGNWTRGGGLWTAVDSWPAGSGL